MTSLLLYTALPDLIMLTEKMGLGLQHLGRSLKSFPTNTNDSSFRGSDSTLFTLGGAEEESNLSEGLWRRARSAGARTPFERRAFGIADDIYAGGLFMASIVFISLSEPGSIDGPTLQRLLENTFRLDLKSAREYCIADDRWVEAVQFLDLDEGAGWELLQALELLKADIIKKSSSSKERIIYMEIFTQVLMPKGTPYMVEICEFGEQCIARGPEKKELELFKDLPSLKRQARARQIA